MKNKKIVIIDKEKSYSWNILDKYELHFKKSIVGFFDMSKNIIQYDLIIINNKSNFLEYYLKYEKSDYKAILLCNDEPKYMNRLINFKNLYFLSKPYDAFSLLQNVREIIN